MSATAAEGACARRWTDEIARRIYAYWGRRWREMPNESGQAEKAIVMGSSNIDDSRLARQPIDTQRPFALIMVLYGTGYL